MGSDRRARFDVGTIIRHRLFGYRGVICDVDAVFSGSDEWYRVMARSKPPRDAPWYHVLVHGQQHQTYVAERNLECDAGSEPVSHPLLDDYFDRCTDGVYRRRGTKN